MLFCEKLRDVCTLNIPCGDDFVLQTDVSGVGVSG